MLLTKVMIMVSVSIRLGTDSVSSTNRLKIPVFPRTRPLENWRQNGWESIV